MSALKIGNYLLRVKWSPAFLAQRFRRVNVQRPRAPHYERAKVLALLKPQFKEDPKEYLPPSLKCRKEHQALLKTLREDNPLEKILARELYEECEKSNLVAFLHKNPISGEDEFQAKVYLKREKMDIKIYSKRTAKIAFEGTRYESVLKLFEVHNALVFCDEPKVAELCKVLKKIPQYILLAAIVEDRFLSVSQLQTYVQFKDLTTARAHFVAQLNKASERIVMQLNQPQCTLITRLQQVADAKSKSDQNEA